MAKIHVLLNQKGGVGKSTLTVNLAAVTAAVLDRGDPNEASRVAAVSIDPQGSAIWWADQLEDALPFDVVQAHDDPAGLRALGKLPGKAHIFVDTPGWIPDPKDPTNRFGNGGAADALHAVLESADDVIIPIEPEALGFDPTARTIDTVVEPYGKPYKVVINNWDPRDGTRDLEETKNFIRAKGWPLANTVVRHYKLHARASADGQVVTSYPTNGISLRARADFDQLALELMLGGEQ
jgi:chromosome partitioning protein